MKNRIEYINSLTGIHLNEEYEKIIRKNNLVFFIYDLLFYAPATYYTNGKVQCESNCNRSLTDIYCICKTYFPNETLKSIFNALKRIVFNECEELNNNIKSIKTVYCASTISFVFYHTRYHDYDWGNILKIGRNYINDEYICRPIQLKHSILDFIRITKSYKQMGWSEEDIKKIIELRRKLKPL